MHILARNKLVYCLNSSLRVILRKIHRVLEPEKTSKNIYGYQEALAKKFIVMNIRRYLGISISRSFNLAINSALPPRIISVPRPAILVAIVTAPKRPLCATISASLSTFSGFALRTCRKTKIC